MNFLNSAVAIVVADDEPAPAEEMLILRHEQTAQQYLQLPTSFCCRKNCLLK
jgi:hypothetical protein